MITTLCFYLYPIPVFLKTLTTTSYALLVYYVLHVASPRINEAKHFIISHVACKYTCLKVSDVAIYHNDHPPTIQRLRDRYQATGTVKDRRRSSQPRMATGVNSQAKPAIYRRNLHRRYPFRLGTVSVRRIVGPRG